MTCSAEPTLLVAPAELAGAAVEVRDAAYRHLFRARRLAVGDPVRVVDGAGRARRGRVVAVDRERALLALEAALPSRDPARRLVLLVGVPRPERAAWLVEKATELGVAGVRFLASERTGRALGAGALARLRRVAAAALEQCGGARLPEIDGAHPWAALPDLLAGCAERWVCQPGGDGDRPPSAAGGGPAAALVGPEGGFSDEELAHLAALGCRPLDLGPRVLRVETAALAAATLLLAPVPACVDTPAGSG